MAAGLTYVTGSFFAYLLNSEGLTKILCIVQPFSGLLLPWIGKGELAGHPVHSPVWWLLFGVAAVLLGLSTRPAGGRFRVVVMDAGPLGQMSRRRFRDRL